MRAIQKVGMPILFSSISWQAWTQLIHTKGVTKISGIAKKNYLK
jgi:hypothetical protein